MNLSIAYLGPPGTNSETAAKAYADWLAKQEKINTRLCPYPTIAQAIQSLSNQALDLAIVPVENSINGSVAVTLDILWQSVGIFIQQAVILPIEHALLTQTQVLNEIKTVYSHPQALGQCQKWLENNLPASNLIATNSTAEAVQIIQSESKAAAIASVRAAELYQVPVLAEKINDYPDNCTKFWVLSHKTAQKYQSDYISLGFSLAANKPGALVKPLQTFAEREINLTRIESRPTKRSLGEYIFFIDLAAPTNQNTLKQALAQLSEQTEILKIFGRYNLLHLK